MSQPPPPPAAPADCKFSVIIPHHNRFELLAQLVGSIPARADIEVLIIDDASDTATQAKLPALAHHRPNLRLFPRQSTTPQGAGWARNVGLNHASGKYLLFADSDDTFTPDAFAIFDEVTTHQEPEFVVFKASATTPDGRQSDRTAFTNLLIDEARRLQEIDRLRTKGILTKIDPPWAKLVRREMLLRHRITFDEIHYSNDVLFNLRVLIPAQSITVDTREVYNVLDHADSLVQVQSETMLDERFDACLRFNVAAANQPFYDHAFSVTGGYIWQARKYGFPKLRAFIRRSLAHHARLTFPLHRYVLALLFKIAGVDPLKIRFYVVFGYRL